MRDSCCCTQFTLAAGLALAIYACVWSTHAISQRKEVCGPGPHNLNETDFDVYLLPNSYVSLRPSIGDRRSGIIWSRKERNPNNLLGVKQRKHPQIGLMDQTLSLVALKYISNISLADHAVVLPGREPEPISDKGSRIGQVVRVFMVSPQRIYCFKITPYIPVNILLWKRDKEGIPQIVSRNRYYRKGSCLWVNLLQRNDTASYILDIASCFSLHTKHRVNFRLFGTHKAASSPVFSSTTNALSPYHTLENTKYDSQNLIREISDEAEQLSRRSRSSIASIARVEMFNFKPNNAQKTGGHTWNVSLSVNTTLTFSFRMPDLNFTKIRLLKDGTNYNRFEVSMNNRSIKLENVQMADAATYRLWGYPRNNVSRKSILVITVQEILVPTASSSSAASTGTSLSQISISQTSSIQTPSSQTLSSSTPSRDSSLSEEKEHKDGVQGWMIGVIILCILMIFAFPAVYILFKHRQSLRSHFARHRRSKSRKADSKGDPDYANDVMPTVSSDQDKDYANAVPLPDILSAPSTKKTCKLEVETTTTYEVVADILQNQESETEQPQIPELYATVNKNKNSDPRTSESRKETTLNEQSSKNQQIKDKEITPGYAVVVKVSNSIQPQAAPRNRSSKKSNASIKKPAQEPPTSCGSVQDQQFDQGKASSGVGYDSS